MAFDFITVLHGLKVGKKYRRLAWPAGWRIVMQIAHDAVAGGEVLIVLLSMDKPPRPLVIRQADVLSEDWEEVSW